MPTRPWLLISGVLLALSSSALGQEDVPPWAEDWRYIWRDAQANGSVRLTGALTHPLVKLGDTQLFAVLEVRSLNFPQERRQPLNAALILDRSASMKGGRLNVLKKAAIDLVSVLGPRDRLAIVLVSDQTEVAPSVLCTPENKEKLIAFIRATTGRGGSDLSVGLADAYEQVVQHQKDFVYHRVLLISDGRPNKGMADPHGLADIAGRVRESENIHTSTLTIGRDSDVALMRGIATQGWGFTGNLEDASHLFRVGRRLTTDVMRKAADRVELTVRLAEDVRLVDVLEHAAEVDGRTLTLPLHELGHNEQLRVVLRLSVLTSSAAGTPAPILEATLRYHDGLVDRDREVALSLGSTVSLDEARVTDAIESRALLTAARSVAARSVARAQDRFDEGEHQEARAALGSARRFLEETSQVSGILTSDEQEAIRQLEERLFPARRPPPATPKTKKRRRG